jgi:membrane protein DedA with SNARE-associated domain
VTHLVDTYGYWAVILVTGLEAFGIPIPGETVLIAAGTYAGQSHHLSVWLIWLYATLAVLVGSGAGYWVGVKGGYRLLRRYGRYLHMNEKEIKLGRYVFDRFGAPVVSLGRFVAVLRTYAPFLAGTNRMAWPKFLVFNLIGAVAWAGLWTELSYHVGNSLKHASSTVDLAVGIAAAVLVVAIVIVIRRQARRLEAAAEAAYPGPLPD